MAGKTSAAALALPAIFSYDRLVEFLWIALSNFPETAGEKLLPTRGYL
jgi:hypothetical protein